MQLSKLIPSFSSSDAARNIVNVALDPFLSGSSQKNRSKVELGLNSSINTVVSTNVGSTTIHTSDERIFGMADAELIDTSADTRTFSWMPPIDIDKFVNYENYYWSGDYSETPQYITTENRADKDARRSSPTFIDDVALWLDFPISAINFVHNKIRIQYDINDANYARLQRYLTPGIVFSYKLPLSMSVTTINAIKSIEFVEDGCIITYSKPNACRVVETDFWFENVYESDHAFSPLPNITYRLPDADGWCDLIGFGCTLSFAASAYGMQPIADANPLLSTGAPLDIRTAVDTAIRYRKGVSGHHIPVVTDISQYTTKLTSYYDQNADSLNAQLSPTFASGHAYYDSTNDVLYVYVLGNVLSDWIVNFSVLIDFVNSERIGNYSYHEDGASKWTSVQSGMPANLAHRTAKLPIIEYSDRVESNKVLKKVHQWSYRATQTSTLAISSIFPSPLEVCGGIKNTQMSVSQVSQDEVLITSSWGPLLTDWTVGFSSTTQKCSMFDIAIGTEVFVYDGLDVLGQYAVIGMERSTHEWKLLLRGHLPAAINDGSSHTLGDATILPVYTSKGDSYDKHIVQWVYDGVVGYEPTANVLMLPPVSELYNKTHYVLSNSLFGSTLLVGSVGEHPLNSQMTCTFECSQSISLPFLSNFVGGLPDFVKLLRYRDADHTITEMSWDAFQVNLEDSTVSITFGATLRNQLAENDELRLVLLPPFAEDLGKVGIMVGVKLNDAVTRSAVDCSDFVLVNDGTTSHNLFDPATNAVTIAAPILEFNVSSAADVDLNAQKRISRTQMGGYELVNNLIDGTTNKIRMYRDLSTVTQQFWKHPDRDQVLSWSVHGWSEYLVANTAPNQFTIASTKVSSNSAIAGLYYTAAGVEYNDGTYDVVVSKIDPTLRTIWCKTTSYLSSNQLATDVGNIKRIDRSLVDTAGLQQHINEQSGHQIKLSTEHNRMLFEVLPIERQYVGNGTMFWNYGQDALFAFINLQTVSGVGIKDVLDFINKQQQQYFDVIRASIVDYLPDYLIGTISWNALTAQVDSDIKQNNIFTDLWLKNDIAVGYYSDIGITPKSGVQSFYDEELGISEITTPDGTCIEVPMSYSEFFSILTKMFSVVGTSPFSVSSLPSTATQLNNVIVTNGGAPLNGHYTPFVFVQSQGTKGLYLLDCPITHEPTSGGKWIDVDTLQVKNADGTLATSQSISDMWVRCNVHQYMLNGVLDVLGGVSGIPLRYFSSNVNLNI